MEDKIIALPAAILVSLMLSVIIISYMDKYKPIRNQRIKENAERLIVFIIFIISFSLFYHYL